MHPDAELWLAKRALSAAHRDVTRWGRLLRIAANVPLSAPIELAYALALRDLDTAAHRKPLLAKAVDRFDRAQGDLQAARIAVTDLTH